MSRFRASDACRYVLRSVDEEISGYENPPAEKPASEEAITSARGAACSQHCPLETPVACVVR
jgi:hypothetical protein